MQRSRAELRVVQGGVESGLGDSPDPDRFQADCVDAYVASWVARGFSQVTVDSSTTRLERVLATLGKPAWEVTAEDIDQLVGTWAEVGIVVGFLINREQKLVNLGGLFSPEAPDLEDNDSGLPSMTDGWQKKCGLDLVVTVN